MSSEPTGGAAQLRVCSAYCSFMPSAHWADTTDSRTPFVFLNTRTEPLRQAAFALWSNQDSFVHRLDARVKLVLMMAFIVSLALLRFPSALQLAACLAAA